MNNDKTTYFKVWWNNVQVGQRFQTKKDAEKYISQMRIKNWEIVEFNSDLAVVNRWTA
ncbi:hypothetical protein AABM38_20630 [Heyndrickxia sp. MSNUG]|uniref:hypothetical protein n=1 Tax=Heyndrickxia sp. MSNUG TaxID=3136677 RepID=UPI003C2D1AD3